MLVSANDEIQLFVLSFSALNEQYERHLTRYPAVCGANTARQREPDVEKRIRYGSDSIGTDQYVGYSLTTWSSISIVTDSTQESMCNIKYIHHGRRKARQSHLLSAALRSSSVIGYVLSSPFFHSDVSASVISVFDVARYPLLVLDCLGCTMNKERDAPDSVRNEMMALLIPSWIPSVLRETSQTLLDILTIWFLSHVTIG